MKINIEEYFSQMINEFPEIINKINSEELLHFKMEIFSDYTIRQIMNNNIEEVIRCFNFQESKIDLINKELLNTLNVSYFESLLLGEISSKMNEIEKLFPKKLRIKYLEYKKYYLSFQKE